MNKKNKVRILYFLLGFLIPISVSIENHFNNILISAIIIMGIFVSFFAIGRLDYEHHSDKSFFSLSAFTTMWPFFIGIILGAIINKFLGI